MNFGLGARGGLDLGGPSTVSASRDESMDLEVEEGLGDEGGDVSRGSPELDLKRNSRGEPKVSSE